MDAILQSLAPEKGPERPHAKAVSDHVCISVALFRALEIKGMTIGNASTVGSKLGEKNLKLINSRHLPALNPLQLY